MAVMNFCPSCGSPQDAGANFCVGCGFKLDSIKVPPPDNASAPNPVGSSGYDTRSIGQTIASRVSIADQNAANALSGLNDSDAQFTACMLTKGYKVPTGILPKLKAALPDLRDHETGKMRDEGLKALAEAAFGVIDPFVMALVDAAGDAAEVYDHAALAYAAIDCAARVHAGEQFSAPEPVTPPSIPVLPPPPPNWQPLIVPMADPTPPAIWQPVADVAPVVAKIADGSMSVPMQLAWAVTIFFCVGVVLFLGFLWIKYDSNGGGQYYAHYNCNGDQTCAYFMGGPNLGIKFGPVSTESDCISISRADRNFVINNGGQIWCDQSSNPAETS